MSAAEAAAMDDALNQLRTASAQKRPFEIALIDAGELGGVDACRIVEKYVNSRPVRTREGCSGLEVQAIAQARLDDLEPEHTRVLTPAALATAWDAMPITPPDRDTPPPTAPAA